MQTNKHHCEIYYDFSLSLFRRISHYKIILHNRDIDRLASVSRGDTVQRRGWGWSGQSILQNNVNSMLAIKDAGPALNK